MFFILLKIDGRLNRKFNGLFNFILRMLYFVRTPKWLQRLFPGRLWEMDRSEKKIYLSFDDGPHPEHTAFVLDELKKYGAKAVFFCIGNNVRQYPEIYRRIIDEGHSVGNHTQNHLNSRKVSDSVYMKDVHEASKYIDSKLFRPPYGRLNRFRENLFKKNIPTYRLIMWTVLSGDFDPGLTKEQCLENVLLRSGNGSIIVFHDSEKAAEKMRYVLPKMLQSFYEKGFAFEKIKDIPPGK